MTRRVSEQTLLSFTSLTSTGMAAGQGHAAKAPTVESRYDARLERNVVILIRDGISLAAHLFGSYGVGKFPVIVECRRREMVA